jgi:hypothetical protein
MLKYRNGQPYAHWESDISADRKAAVTEAVGSWSFSAHSFSDDELVYGAAIMLQHALQMPELGEWRLSPGASFGPFKNDTATNS